MVPNAKLWNTSSDHLHAQHFPIQNSLLSRFQPFFFSNQLFILVSTPFSLFHYFSCGSYCLFYKGTDCVTFRSQLPLDINFKLQAKPSALEISYLRLPLPMCSQPIIKSRKCNVFHAFLIVFIENRIRINKVIQR